VPIFLSLNARVTKNYLRKSASIARQDAIAIEMPSFDDWMKTRFGRTAYVIKMIDSSVALLL
jgi:hypothetical protein